MSRKLCTKILSLFLITISFYACDDDPVIISLNNQIFDPSIYFEIMDTFQVETSTVMIDSIPSSGNEFGLLGGYDNERTGKLRSDVYFSIGFPSTIVFDDDDRCDSASLILSLNGYYFGDTTDICSFSVHELTEEIEARDDGSVYSHQEFDYKSESIGELQFNPRPVSDTLLEIPLTYEFAERLHNLLLTRNELIDNDDTFGDFIKGLVLVSDASSKVAVGLNFTTEHSFVRLYTSRKGETRLEVNQDFGLLTPGLQFNHFDTDFSNSEFSGLKAGNLLASEESDKQTLSQGALGVFTRIDFSSLESLYQIGGVGEILKAELVFKPVIVNQDYNALPDALMLYTTRKKNFPESEVVDASGNTVYSTKEIDKMYNESTQYTLDITYYITAEISDNYIDPEDGLLLSVDAGSIFAGMDGVLMGAGGLKNFEPELRVYYVHL